MTRQLKIGEVAKLAGTTPRTIRYYEEIGLLPAVGARQPGAHRTYAESDVDRLTELLREWRGGVEDPVRRRQILEQSLTYIARQLELVRRRREEIAKLEDELISRRKRARTLLRELEGEPVER
jgi:DNA-binding transcriptional MerR regulator